MIRRLAVLAVLTCAGAAHAAPWSELGVSPVGRLSIDTGSIRTRDGNTSFTYRIDLPAAQKNSAGKAYQSAVIDAFVSCRERTIAVVRGTVYALSGGKGDVVGRSTYASAPKPASSEGSEGLLMKAACARTPG